MKYHLRDGAGRNWVVKVGNEARPETAAVRLVSALGYVTGLNYLVPCVHNAVRASRSIPGTSADSDTSPDINGNTGAGTYSGSQSGHWANTL